MGPKHVHLFSSLCCVKSWYKKVVCKVLRENPYGFTTNSHRMWDLVLLTHFKHELQKSSLTAVLSGCVSSKLLPAVSAKLRTTFEGGAIPS